MEVRTDASLKFLRIIILYFLYPMSQSKNKPAAPCLNQTSMCTHNLNFCCDSTPPQRYLTDKIITELLWLEADEAEIWKVWLNVSFPSEIAVMNDSQSRSPSVTLCSKLSAAFPFHESITPKEQVRKVADTYLLQSVQRWGPPAAPECALWHKAWACPGQWAGLHAPTD